MNPRIVISNEKKLVGNRFTMSLTDYKVAELWKRFMPRRKEILHNLSRDLISMTVYPPTFFTKFDSANEFEKWATIEVSDFDSIPGDMETFILKGGLYSVFDYRGSSDDRRIYEYIFGVWLPNSDYLLDDRPHVEVLGDKYKNCDPTSEEEIWIPVKTKS
jgi:AraC family transcriptional regulator